MPIKDRKTADSCSSERSSGRAMDARMQQSRVLRLDRRIALARRLDQAVEVGDLDMPAAIVNEIRLLQRVGHQRYAVTARADHLRHRFLGQDELVAAGKVAHVQ